MEPRAERKSEAAIASRKSTTPPTPRVKDAKGGSSSLILRTLATRYLGSKDRKKGKVLLDSPGTKELLSDIATAGAPLADLRKKTVLYFENTLILRMQLINENMALMANSKEAKQLERNAVAPLRDDIEQFKVVYDKYIKLVNQAFSDAETKLKQVGGGDKSPKSKVPLMELKRRITELNKAYQDDVKRNFINNPHLLQRLTTVEKLVGFQVVAFQNERFQQGIQPSTAHLS